MTAALATRDVARDGRVTSAGRTALGAGRVGKPPAPREARCEWASCTGRATATVDCWVFCRDHARDHIALRTTGDIRIPDVTLPLTKQRDPRPNEQLTRLELLDAVLEELDRPVPRPGNAGPSYDPSPVRLCADCADPLARSPQHRFPLRCQGCRVQRDRHLHRQSISRRQTAALCAHPQ